MQTSADTTESSAGISLCSAAGLIALQRLSGVDQADAMHLALSPAEADPYLEERGLHWAQAIAEAQEEVARCEQEGIAVVSLFDPAYPERLRAIDQPPPVLYVKGEVDLLSQSRSIALTGTMKPSEVGIEVTEGLASVLASSGWVLVAGLLAGIADAGYRAAFAQESPAIAVVGGGLAAPLSAHRTSLATDLLDRGGALVSIHPLDRAAGRAAALESLHLSTSVTAALVVVESSLGYAPMRLVRHAAELRRPIFCAKPAPRVGGKGKVGLELLLEAPAAQLIEEIPRWKSTLRLVSALGDAPLAQPLPADPAEFVATVERLLETEPRPLVARWTPDPEVQPPLPKVQAEADAEDDSQTEPDPDAEGDSQDQAEEPQAETDTPQPQPDAALAT